jgi:hypothetical protein
MGGVFWFFLFTDWSAMVLGVDGWGKLALGYSFEPQGIGKSHSYLEPNSQSMLKTYRGVECYWSFQQPKALEFIAESLRGVGQ